MPKTIKQDDYPQFFEYYKYLIKEMNEQQDWWDDIILNL